MQSITRLGLVVNDAVWFNKGWRNKCRLQE